MPNQRRQKGESTERSIGDGRVSYEQLRTIFDDLHIGVFTVDAKRRLTSFNRTAESLTGYKEKEVLGKYCYEIFNNKLCYGECKFHQAVEAEQKSLSFNLEMVDRFNERQLITKIVTPLYDAAGRVRGCMEIFQSHHAFEDLINRILYDERKLKIILDSLDIGVFTTTRDGHVSFYNTRAESISGYSRQEVLGKPSSVVFGEENTRDPALMLAAISDGKPRENREALMRAKDGRRIPVEASYMALRNEQGRVVGGLATVVDLSLIHELNRAIKGRYTFEDMIGKAPSMQRIFEIVPIVAASDATVLIEGPTGTGKDLLAKVIHNASGRAKRPMVKVNCAALPDTLLESEMFGYAKGAFTGADRDKPGRFQEADGGTIFLDEIGDLPLSLQAKLLRVLEDKEFYPLGSRKTTKVDVRIIAATNQGLQKQVSERRFREDLFYRLNVIRLELPPLRERQEDVPLMIEHILKRLRAVMRTRVERISREAMEVLLNYDFPGNVRELENILEHAMTICQGEAVELKHLPLSLQKAPAQAALRPILVEGGALSEPRSEKDRIAFVLNRHDGHRGRAAVELGMDRTTLWRKIKKYGL